MGALTKDRLIFDPADLTQSDNIGAYLRAGDDGDLLSSTNVGGKEGLDINIINTQVDVNVTNASLVVTATDLDIRNLSHTQDSVKVGDGTDFLAVNADGSINVIFTSAVADDAPDTENPIKVGSHAVSGALAAISTTGDKANLISDMYRRIFINDSPNISVNSRVLTVGTAEVAFPAALAGRRRLMLQNTSDADVFIGPTGLSTTTGMRIAKGATLSLEVGQNVNLFAIAGSNGRDVRVFELA